MISSVVSEDAYQEIVADVRRKFTMKPRVAIAGFGKSGKSSLYNAIYGSKVASVSMKTDETVEAQTRERFGIDFTDTPGIGTGKFSLEKVVEMGVLEKQHLVIHVLNATSAISDDDEALHEALEKSSVARITVVNKADLLDDKEKGEYAESMKEKLGLWEKDFLFISAKKRDGIEELIARIANALPDAMQDAFIAQQQGDIKIKERRIRALIYAKAAACGAVAVTPIPVADLFVITPIQVALVTTIGYLHGVELTKERVIEFISTVAAGVGLREAARQLVKLVPGYGSAVSAGVSFAGTVALGEAANLWFKQKMKVDAGELRALFKKTAEQAKDEYGEHQEKAEIELGPRVKRLRAAREAGELTQEEFERQLSEL